MLMIRKGCAGHDGGRRGHPLSMIDNYLNSTQKWPQKVCKSWFQTFGHKAKFTISTFFSSLTGKRSKKCKEVLFDVWLSVAKSRNERVLRPATSKHTPGTGTCMRIRLLTTHTRGAGNSTCAPVFAKTELSTHCQRVQPSTTRAQRQDGHEGNLWNGCWFGSLLVSDPGRENGEDTHTRPSSFSSSDDSAAAGWQAWPLSPTAALSAAAVATFSSTGRTPPELVWTAEKPHRVCAGRIEMNLECFDSVVDHHQHRQHRQHRQHWQHWQHTHTQANRLWPNHSKAFLQLCCRKIFPRRWEKTEKLISEIRAFHWEEEEMEGKRGPNELLRHEMLQQHENLPPCPQPEGKISRLTVNKLVNSKLI